MRCILTPEAHEVEEICCPKQLAQKQRQKKVRDPRRGRRPGAYRIEADEMDWL